MQEISSKRKYISFCELCADDHRIDYCPPSDKKVNYVNN